MTMRSIFQAVRQFMGSCDGSEYDRMTVAEEQAGILDRQMTLLCRENAALLSALSDVADERVRTVRMNGMFARLASAYGALAAGGSGPLSSHYRTRARHFQALARPMGAPGGANAPAS